MARCCMPRLEGTKYPRFAQTSRAVFSQEQINFVTKGSTSSASKLRSAIFKIRKNLLYDFLPKTNKKNIAKLMEKYFEHYIGMLIHAFNCCFFRIFCEFCFVISQLFVNFVSFLLYLWRFFFQFRENFSRYRVTFKLENLMDCDFSQSRQKINLGSQKRCQNSINKTLIRITNLPDRNMVSLAIFLIFQNRPAGDKLFL